MKTLLYLIFLAIFLTGCTVKKKIAEKSTYEISSDTNTYVSHVEKEYYRDTVIILAADTSSIKALIECDSLGNAYIKRIEELQTTNSNLRPQIQIQDNFIYLDCIIDSTAIYLKIRERYEKDSISNNTWVEEKQTYTKEKTVTRVSYWQWIIIGVVILIVIIIIRFAWKFFS